MNFPDPHSHRRYVPERERDRERGRERQKEAERGREREVEELNGSTCIKYANNSINESCFPEKGQLLSKAES